jgi:hypothetical protein
MGGDRIIGILTAIVVNLVSHSAAAQESRTPIEVGATFSLQQVYWSFDGPSSAVGVWLDAPLMRRVAIEARATWVPSERDVLLQSPGGSTLYLSAGVRGKFVSRPKYAVIGTLSPELVRVTRTVTAVERGADVIGTATYFSLGSNVGVEIYPAARWLVRAEFATSTFPARGFELGRSEPGANGGVLVALQPATTQTSWQLRGGVGIRIGTLVREQAELRTEGRWDAGIVLSHMTGVVPLADQLEANRDTGLGGFASFKLSDYVYADGAVTFFFDDVRFFSPYTGGRTLHALGGIKIGPRRDRYGVFLKMRAGVNSSSSVLKTLLASEQPRVFGRSNDFATEFGGVLERDLQRRLFLRFEASILTTFFRSLSYTFEGQPVTIDPPERNDSLQMSVGVGYRFR